MNINRLIDEPYWSKEFITSNKVVHIYTIAQYPHFISLYKNYSKEFRFLYSMVQKHLNFIDSNLSDVNETSLEECLGSFDNGILEKMLIVMAVHRSCASNSVESIRDINDYVIKLSRVLNSATLHEIKNQLESINLKPEFYEKFNNYIQDRCLDRFISSFFTPFT